VTLTFTLLGLAILAVWLPALPLARGLTLPPWAVLFAFAVASGIAADLIDAPAWIALIALAAAGWGSQRGHRRRLRTLMLLFAALLALALALHAVPGFRNPLVASQIHLGADSPPISLYANFDKGAAGLLLLACHARRIRDRLELRRCMRAAWPVVAATVLVVLGTGVLLGYVRLEPKWPPIAPAFLAINLLFTCVAEEAFFRGLLQERLAQATGQRRLGRWLPVAVSTGLFGLAHAAGGPYAMAFATLAGLGYALAYARTRRIEAAILTHFAVNAVHFLGFSYPYLLR